MDFNNLTAKVKVFQRRTTQKVLQQMGMAEKTEDDSPSFQNFLALGSFVSQLKSTLTQTNANFEKACQAQTHMASQIQSYLHSEFSGDGEVPPGELSEFFSGNDAHSAVLEAISAKFCDASTEIGHHALIQVLGQLDDLILKPIQKDDEFGVVTKDLIEEKKRATLDYDSYRRNAQNASSPMEHERAEAKVRAARDKHEDITRRVAEHINQRNQIRCKLLVHSILTAIEQYCNFYTHAVDILRDTANSLKPLLDVYQLNDAQLRDTVNLGAQPARGQDPRAKSPPQGKVSADSLFTDYENQNRGKPAAQAPTPNRAGPNSPQLDNMMRDNLNLKKPAAQQQAGQRNMPMNQLNNANAGVRTPPPTHHVNSQQPQQNSPLPTHQSPQPQQPQPQQPQQPLFDLFGDHTAPARPTTPQAPKEEILVNLMDHSTPSKSGGDLFGGDIFGGAPPTMPSTPAMQPSNLDPFAELQFNKGQKVNSLDKEWDDILGTKSPPKNNIPPQPQPQRQQQQQQQQQQHQQQPSQQGFFDDFMGGAPGGASGGAPPTKPTPVFVSPTSGPAEHELNPAVTQRITNWAERGGRKANLRALLSTLHEVIWVDSGWDAMSLGELITPVQVKKAYHRANLIVHPDKVQNGTVEQQLMAKRIFEALRVSYETFKDEPK